MKEERLSEGAEMDIEKVRDLVKLVEDSGVEEIELVSGETSIRIRKSIGAKPYNILTQFLLEAVVLCNIGGVIGVLVGFGAPMVRWLGPWLDELDGPGAAHLATVVIARPEGLSSFAKKWPHPIGPDRR